MLALFRKPLDWLAGHTESQRSLPSTSLVTAALQPGYPVPTARDYPFGPEARETSVGA